MGAARAASTARYINVLIITVRDHGKLSHRKYCIRAHTKLDIYYTFLVFSKYLSIASSTCQWGLFQASRGGRPWGDEMTSRIEFLPMELLESIFDHLEEDAFYPSVTSLIRSCRRLHSRLEPWLYGRHPEAVSRALRWGCREGSAEAVRLAVVAYGADASVAGPIRAPDEDDDGGSGAAATAVSTLYRAARHHQPAVFRLLLDLGAGLYDPAAPEPPAAGRVVQYRRLARSIRGILKGNWQQEEEDGQEDDEDDGTRRRKERGDDGVDLFARIVRAGLFDQMRAEPSCPPNVYDQLALLIYDGAPTALVRELLDRGADPDGLRQGPSSVGSLCPLSAAVLVGSPDIFRLLLERGADIHSDSTRCEEGATTEGGVRRSNPSRGLYRPYRLSGTYIPVFAAAGALARRQPRARLMMRLCLEAGADLTRRMPLDHEWRPEQTVAFEGTALHKFLDTVSVWDEENDGGGDSAHLDLSLWMDHYIKKKKRTQTRRGEDNDHDNDSGDDYNGGGYGLPDGARHIEESLEGATHLDNLQLLLNHGAAFDSTMNYGFFLRPKRRQDVYTPEDTWRNVTLSLVLDVWAGRRLHNPRRAAFVELLVRRGAARGSTADLLTRYVNTNRTGRREGADWKPVLKWEEERFQAEDEAGMLILARLLVQGLREDGTDPGFSPPSPSFMPSEFLSSTPAKDELQQCLATYVWWMMVGWVPDDAVGRSTVTMLVRDGGADLNAACVFPVGPAGRRADGRGDGEPPRPPLHYLTLLHLVCRWGEPPLRRFTRRRALARSYDRLERDRRIMRFLVGLGADPTLRFAGGSLEDAFVRGARDARKSEKPYWVGMLAALHKEIRLWGKKVGGLE